MSRFVHDLERDALPDVCDSDVCVIGSGPVGLTIARALAERHRSVTIFERGPLRAAEPAADEECVFDRRVYRGTTTGRAFGAGGTSALWGGQLLPVRPEDLNQRQPIGAPAWPLQYSELARYFESLGNTLQVVGGGFNLDSLQPMRHPLTELRWGEWTPRLSKWLPFGRRNLYTALETELAASQCVEAYVNAQVSEWELRGGTDGRRIIEARARSANGRPLRARARVYVICAGALESARCVLELNEAAGGLGSGVAEYTGRFLHDHLSVRLGSFEIKNYPEFERLFAPVFVGTTMRSLRMELDNGFLEKEGLPRLYAHFVSEAPLDSGFAILRDVLRGLQKRNFQSAYRKAWGIPKAMPEVASILFNRYFHRRLSFSRQGTVHLHCDFEQAPLHENRVYLGSSVNGRARPLHIDWDLGGNIKSVLSAVQTVFARFWGANALDRIARLEPVDLSTDAPLQPNNLYDIYHPAGTTRMSSDPQRGVVDPNLRIHGTSNAFVAGSSVFPSMGAANPTFTAMALGLRLAEFIDHALSGEQYP